MALVWRRTLARRPVLSSALSGVSSSASLPVKSARFEVRQGGTVIVDLRPPHASSSSSTGSINSSSSRAQTLEIVSAWQDFCAVEQPLSAPQDYSFHTDAKTNTLTITSTLTSAVSSADQDQDQGQPARLRVIVPQSIDLSVSSSGPLHLSIKNKIEGDVSIDIPAGSVEVDKIRGMNLLLHCNRASVKANKLLEGNVQVTTSSLFAKMINGDSVNIISSGDCNVEAMYVQQSEIAAAHDVAIKTFNGSAVVHSARGNVTIGGIDGSFDVLADTGNISLQINKLTPGIQSFATATRGQIAASVDPELQASLRGESLGIAGRAKVTIVSDAFVTQAQSPGSVAGVLTGKSSGVKRPPSAGKDAAAASTSTSTSSSSSGRGRSGKIDLRGAERQALSGRKNASSEGPAPPQRSSSNSHYNFPRPDYMTHPQHASANVSTFFNNIPSSNSSGGNSGSGGIGSEVSPNPDMTLIAHGHVRIETLSWIEAIRRRHGFGTAAAGTAASDSPVSSTAAAAVAASASAPPAGIGRTASAAQRARELEGK